jgi:integrase/recombinase XerD
VQRIPPATIARLYYDPDLTQHAATPEAMERYLRTMRDELVQLALLHGSPVLAGHLKASIRQHGSAKLTAVTLRMVEDASKLAAAVPFAMHPVGLWFRPLIARRLTGEGIATLGELVEFCNRRGGSWWRSVPRIGLRRARILVAWLRRHADTLGVTVDADVDAAEPLAAPAATHVALVPAGSQGTHGGPLAPLERIELPHRLSGGEGPHGTGLRGVNRAPGLCYLQAQHDLDAIRSYLHRYTDRPQALRAYTHELERLLLWAVTERGTALSSLSVDDCNAYKAFLAALAAVRPGWADTGQPEVRGPRATRGVRLAREGPLSGRQSLGGGERPGHRYAGIRDPHRAGAAAAAVDESAHGPRRPQPEPGAIGSAMAGRQSGHPAHGRLGVADHRGDARAP